MSSTATGSSPEVFVRNVFGSSTIEKVGFLQQNEYLTILKVQYDTHELHTQTSLLTIRDSSFLEGVQFIFSHLANYIDVVLENVSISHTANGALNVSGSIPALYTIVLRNVPFVENIYNESLVDDNLGSDPNIELVTLTGAQTITFIDCDFSRNFFNSLGISTLVSLDASHNVAFIGCDFFRNYGHGISYVVNLKNNSYDVTFIDCNFSGNNFLGDIVSLGSSSLNVTFIDCHFTGNIAMSGGIVFLYISHKVTFIDCDFTGNSINVVDIYNSYDVVFVNCSIYKNKDTSSSGINVAYGSMLLVNSHNVTFANCIIYTNTVTAIYRTAYILYLSSAQNVTFTDCIFSNNKGTPISAYKSNFTLSGTILFSNNTAFEGGALALTGESYVYIANNTNVIFLNNTAENVGGAVFVRSFLPVTPLTFPSSFLQFHAINTFSHCFQCGCRFPQFNIYFINNTAKEGGNTLYGVHVYVSQLHISGMSCYFSDLLNSRHFYFEPSLKSDLSVISSDPTRVFLCEDGKPSCALVLNSGPNYTHYPGEEFSISGAAVGDMFGTVAGSVYAHILPLNNGTLGELQHSQQTNSHKCTQLNYSLFSEPGLVVMAFTATNIPVQNYLSNFTSLSGGVIDHWFLNTPVYINITLLSCPIGFMISNSSRPQCVCDHLLHGLDITCNITNQIIHRRGAVWVSSEDNGIKLMITNHCPYGYCKTGDVNVSLDHPDTQCAFNHSGILCGGCQPGLSLALGSSQCLDCSNNYNLALLILFALAGLALVFFIKVLNFTVAKGTINGLIFYANIVQANQAVFFPPGPAVGLYPIKVFIAWLNLDLGITTCFFDGLDGY